MCLLQKIGFIYPYCILPYVENGYICSILRCIIVDFIRVICMSTLFIICYTLCSILLAIRVYVSFFFKTI